MDGYVYCFSNISMPGILKVGMTERTPDIRLTEANASDTWRPPTPYKIEFAKKVTNAKNKENILHSLLEQYTERINPRREFFRITKEEVYKFFELMDGELWVDSSQLEDEDEDDNISATTNVKGCRDMSKCFKNGQRIRHIIGINKIWIGTYDSIRNGIVCNDEFYSSLSNFALFHIREYNPTRMSINGWSACECEVDGKWISTYSLPG